MKLRNYKISDAKRLFDILSNDTEIPFWCGFRQHKTISDTLLYIINLRNEKYWYAIVDDNDQVIGSISLVNKDDGMELGYWISKEYRGQHIVSNFAKKLIEFAFEKLNIETIYCGYFEGNDSSKLLQEKIGFKEYDIIDVPFATGKEHLTKIYRKQYATN